MTTITVPVVDIYLDIENPRHEPILDQEKIIEHLVKEERVRKLATHIAQYGVNPLELTAVIEDKDGNYIVVEGNRRLCALHLLNDPDKAPLGDAPFFRKLKESSSKIPKEIDCVVFSDYEDASVWMTVRHDGEQDGIGTKSWRPEQKSRFNARVNRGDKNALALAIIDYAVNRGFINERDRKGLLTTAARYIGNPLVRNYFGIVSSRSESYVIINKDCHEFDRIIQRFSNDLIENEIVNSRTSKKDWESYAVNLMVEGVITNSISDERPMAECLLSKPFFLPTEKSSDANNTNSTPEGSDSAVDETTKPHSSDVDRGTSVNGSSETGQETDQAKGAGSKSTKDPDKRYYIIPNDFSVKMENKVLRRAYKELKEIKVDEYPLSVALVTRAFLENVYITYYESKIDIFHDGTRIHVVIEKIFNHLDKNKDLNKGLRNSLGALKKLTSNLDSPLSPKSLGANAHAGFYPDPKGLKRDFDNISEIVKYLIMNS